MPTSKNFIAYLDDCLRDISGTRFKAMFGEYALYLNDVVVGLVCDQTLFVRITEETSVLLHSRVKTGLPYDGARPAYALTEAELEDDDLMGRVLSAVYRDRLPRAKTPAKTNAKPKSKHRPQVRSALRRASGEPGKKKKSR